MTGITDLDVYVPRYRLSGKTLAGAWGVGGKGERSLAGPDEDPITLAVTAAIHAGVDQDPSGFDGIFFASTTPPYLERGNASMIAGAINAPRHAWTVDFGYSLRAGVGALRTAADMVRSGALKQVLVTVADVRQAEAGSEHELQLGDAGVSMTVGGGELLAEVLGAAAVNDDFTDHWRTDEDKFVQAGDARFIQDYGFAKLLPEAVKLLLEQNGVAAGDVAHYALYAPSSRVAKQIAGAIGITDQQVVGADLLDKIGNTGTTSPFLALAAALERAKVGDLIVLAGYGAGAEALLLKVGPRVTAFQARSPLSRELTYGRQLEQYGKYLLFRNLVTQPQLDTYSSLMLEWREQAANLRLLAPRCNQCSSIQFPPQQVCWKCHSRDDFTVERLTKRGKVVTFTGDQVIPNPDAPTIMVSVDLEGGGRFYAQMVDCSLDQVKIGMEVELIFRRLHRGGGWYNYFWKFRPAN